MNGWFILFLCMMVGALGLLLLAQTEWANDNARWLTKLWCFVLLGLVLGAGMVGLCYIAASGVVEWMRAGS